MFTTSAATIEREIGSKGFGFIRAIHDGVEIQIFTRQERLDEAGLKTGDFKEGERIALDYEKQPDGRYRAVKIHSGSDKVQSMPAPIGHIKDFLCPFEVAENQATGEVLWRIENPKKEIVQYVVCDRAGNMLRQLGRVASNDARISIGLEAKAPKARVVRRRKDVSPTLLAAE